jgi:polar amino acid transport system substrate-binding protein
MRAVSTLGVIGRAVANTPSSPFPLLRRARNGIPALNRLGIAVIAALACCGGPYAALAQETPFVPDEWKYGRRQDGSTLQYCLDVRDPDLPVARRIGKAIAEALLLTPKPHEIGQNAIGEDIDNLYRVFLETCDVYLGFKLMPRSLAIGATIGTSADIRLIQYLQALAPDDRWSRFPMGSDELALGALMRGTVGVALVWAPSFWALRQADPAFANIRIISEKPLVSSAVDVGATLLAKETFLRSNIDQAIASLAADGTIQSILDSEKFPAAPIK